MIDETMTLEQFRAAKESGVDLYEQQVEEDAAPQEEVTEEIPEEPEQPSEEQEEPEIPKEHQTAWQKRAERERRKGAEEAEAKLKGEYESELTRYKRFFEASGLDPDQALKALEQNRIKEESRRAVTSEAQQLAYQYGWDDQQTEDYINHQADILSRQRQQEGEMRELRVAVAINDLADKPDYPGIKGMKSQITEFVRANPSVSVEQAYWAVGGSSLAQQLKREAEQREIAKRSQTPRKVVTDGGKVNDTGGSLTPEQVSFMRSEGLSEAQMRFMLTDKPMTLAEYRKIKGG